MIKTEYVIQYKPKGEQYKHCRYKDFEDTLYWEDEIDEALEHLNSESPDYVFRKHKVGTMICRTLKAV